MNGFFHGWLAAVLFWTGLSFGSAALLMIHHLTDGKWGFAMRRILEAALSPVPLMALLFVPLFFGLADLYPWSRPDEVAADPILQHRRPYMNAVGFAIRAAALFAVLGVVGWRLRRLSLRQDQAGDPEPTRALRRLSGAALLALPIVATLAYLDWVMSLEPHWYSSIFMILICVGQTLTALCLGVFLSGELPPLRDLFDEKLLNQLGNLLLALVLLWSYLMYAQFLIIWMGNLPHEIGWYLHRTRSGWSGVIASIALLHFTLPLIVLLSRRLKERRSVLRSLAAVVFGAHALFVVWLVLPSTDESGAIWFAMASFPLVGLAWWWRFRTSLRSAPLLVRHDPRWRNAHD